MFDNLWNITGDINKTESLNSAILRNRKIENK